MCDDSDYGPHCSRTPLRQCQHLYNVSAKVSSTREADYWMNYYSYRLNNCSPYLQYFMCLYYTPRCDDEDIPQSMCRGFCQAVFQDCQKELQEVGMDNIIQCQGLPATEPCAAPPNMTFDGECTQVVFDILQPF